ncbi:hypothetical protein MBLNU459_g6678t1 [Dothideomycetes sp. NU459]
MTRIVKRSEPQLSASWASMEGAVDDAESISSGDDDQSSQAGLSASRNEHLREALQDNDHGILPRRYAADVDLQKSRDSLLQHSTTQSRILGSQYRASPRKRNTRQQLSEPELTMPSFDGSLDFDNYPDLRHKEYESPRKTMRQSERREHSPRVAINEKRRPARAEGHYSNAQAQQAYPAAVWSKVIVPMLNYTLSIITIALQTLKPIIGYALALWILAGCFIFARNFLFSSVNTALSPLCRIPGSGYLNLPFCEKGEFTSPAGPVEFDKLITAQSAFEDVLTTSAGGASLPLDMKRSEASIRDLKHVVQYSTLPSRNELVFEFAGFVETARQASTDLTRYNSRIGRAVDKILTTNRWTLQVLDGISSSSNHQGTISRLVSNLNILAPFQPPQRVTQDLLFEQYLRHTSAIEEQISSLIFEAQALLRVLDNLDERLDVIADIATRDGIKAQGNKDELFAMLWTKLGGNRGSVNKLDAQLAILKDVSGYRKMAWAHVAGTVVKLQAIAANLEDLRERVAMPDVLGLRHDLPLEMHIREIGMGVDRLESVREEGRRIEGQRVRSILDRDERMAIEAV